MDHGQGRWLGVGAGHDGAHRLALHVALHFDGPRAAHARGA